jgi:DNA-binding NtrC family response regulator
MAASKKPLTFLIVDDDIPLSIFFRDTLLHDNHRVFVAVNEHGALEVIKNESVDIMLCDLVLPGLDGTEIIKTVKQQRTQTFCVLISGYHDQIFSDRIPHSVADLIIAKPILKDTLNRIVQQYLLIHPEK